MKVAYLAPDFFEPSWGVGTLYAHVHLLRRNGIDATVVHSRPGARLEWLDTEVPVTPWPDVNLTGDDLLVVPEVLIDDERVSACPARRAVFVQGSFILLARLDTARRLAERGFSAALAALPHIAEVVRAVANLPSFVVPPFVAPYFFVDPTELDAPRPRRVAVFAKREVPDLPVVLALLRHAVAGELPGLVPVEARAELARWEVVEVADLDHRDVARLLAGTAYFVNVNCYEGFNATVSEAMAAGAVAVCYEAYGGRDFLRDGVNAFVFSNNSILPLVRRVTELMAAGPQATRLATIRRAGHATAAGFTEAATERALLEAIRALAE